MYSENLISWKFNPGLWAGHKNKNTNNYRLYILVSTLGTNVPGMYTPMGRHHRDVSGRRGGGGSLLGSRGTTCRGPSRQEQHEFLILYQG